MTILSIALASSDNSSSKTVNNTSIGGEIVAEKIDGEAKATNEKEALFPVTIATIIYHVVLLITTLYYGMLFSSWGDA